MPVPSMAASASTPSPFKGRMLAFAAILLAAFNLRTAVTSLSPLLDVLGTEFAFGATMTGVLGMAPTAAFALFGVATPNLTHRIGLERTALLAMALACAGLALRALVGGTGGLLATSLLALAGMGFGNVVLPPLVKRYFPSRVGTVSTAYITVLQLGTMLPALAAVPAADAAGWRVSLGMWAVLAAVAAVAWIAVLRAGRRAGSPLARAHEAVVPPAATATQAGVTAPRGRVWRTPLGWGLAVMFGTTSLVTYAMFTWLPLLLVDAGASRAFGGNMVALFSALGLLSALVMPSLATRLRNPFPVVLACGLAYFAAFAGLLWAPMKAPVLWVVLLGLGPGTFPLTLTLINLRTRTPQASAALSGFMQGVGYSLSCLGPLMFGLLHESSHGWTLPFAFLAACVVLTSLSALLVCRPQWLEDQWQR